MSSASAILSSVPVQSTNRVESDTERSSFFLEKRLISWSKERGRDGTERFQGKFEYEVFPPEMNSNGRGCRKVSRQDVRSQQRLNNLKRKEQGHAGKSKIRMDKQRENTKAVVFGKFPEQDDKRGFLWKKLMEEEEKRFVFGLNFLKKFEKLTWLSFCIWRINTEIFCVKLGIVMVNSSISNMLKM